MEEFYINKNFIHKKNYDEKIIKEREHLLESLTVEEIIKYDPIIVMRCHGLDVLYDINREYFEQLMTKELKKKFICAYIMTNRCLCDYDYYGKCLIHLKSDEYKKYNNMAIINNNLETYYVSLYMFESFLTIFNDLSIFKNKKYYEKLLNYKKYCEKHYNEKHLKVLRNHFHGKIEENNSMTEFYKYLLAEDIDEKKTLGEFIYKKFNSHEKNLDSEDSDNQAKKIEKDYTHYDDYFVECFCHSTYNILCGFKEDFFEEFEKIKSELLKHMM
jgi:hypothetical protein